MNLIQFLAMKLHQKPVFIDGMVNSTVVVVYSKTNFVKVVQNLLLFRKLLSCAPTDIARSSCDLSRDWDKFRHKWDYYKFNIAWTFDCQKNLFALDPTQFVNCSKKGSCRLAERNALKIRSRCYETRLLHRDRWWIVDLRVRAQK